MNALALGDQSPPTGVVKDTDVIIVRSGAGFVFHAAGAPEEQASLDLAFGSGKTGMTYVTYLGEDTLFELRPSYFPKERRWYLTPGHESQKASDLGMLYPQEAARRCAGCHASAEPTGGIRPDPKTFGVGCEACHGPGSFHVEAAKAGEKRPGFLLPLRTMPAKDLNELCGKCHRTSQRINQRSVQREMTQRFQAHGIALSKCFQKSGELISCLSCHDPHRDVETNPSLTTGSATVVMREVPSRG